MNIALLSKLLTFLSGIATAGATWGVADPSALPKWLTITCVLLAGGFAKASIGALPTPQVTVVPKGGNEQ